MVSAVGTATTAAFRDANMNYSEAYLHANATHGPEIANQFIAAREDLIGQLAQLYRARATGKQGIEIPTEIKMEITIRLTSPEQK